MADTTVRRPPGGVKGSIPWNKTHGEAGTPFYNLWAAMRRRCADPKCREWPHYGGRGITMFAPWRWSYEVFRDYVLRTFGELPRRPKSIDRIDNDKGYLP